MASTIYGTLRGKFIRLSTTKSEKNQNRKPVEILKIQYSYLAFDQKGRLREDENERAARLSLEMIKASPAEEESNHVIDARYKFAKKRFSREFRWEPSPEIEAAIFKAIFG